MAEKLLSNPVIEDFEVHARGGLKVGVVTFPGSLDDGDARRAVTIGGNEAVALWHGDDDLKGVDAVVLPGGFSYGDYLRCGAISRFAPVMTSVIEAAGNGDAGPRHLQRLPDPLRVPPAARRADPQRPPQVRLPRPAAAHRARRHPVDVVVRRRCRGHDRAQERRGRLRRRRAHPRPARGRGPRRRALPRRQPQRLAARHRRHLQRARQRGRPDAPPRARGRGPDRSRHRRPRLLHLARRRTSSHEPPDSPRRLPRARRHRGDHLGAAADGHVPQVRHRDHRARRPGLRDGARRRLHRLLPRHRPRRGRPAVVARPPRARTGRGRAALRDAALRVVRRPARAARPRVALAPRQPDGAPSARCAGCCATTGSLPACWSSRSPALTGAALVVGPPA